MNRNLKPMNIIISGTNFWNPGDDFVRDGVIKILKTLFPDQVLNFLFYNFNQDFFPQNKFSGIHNMLSKGDLELMKDDINAIVIAGLSAGIEIKDLYNWVIENDLLDRVYLIGAGYENDYVEKYINEEPELTIFKNAKVITGRTRKAPKLITDLNLPYSHINCPAILSVDEVKNIPDDKKIERVAFSIQLPKEIGVSNHSCHISMYELAIKILIELYGKYEIDFIAHHKSEYFHFLNLFRQYQIPINVIFSSFYQDLHKIYPNYDLIITTRLHSSLFANGFGIPGIIINDTDRHTHCLEGFNHSYWVNSKENFDRHFEALKNSSLSQINKEIKIFKENLLHKYLEILSKPFGSEIKTKGTLNLEFDKLNIGCGSDYREGFINVDGNKNLKTDLVLDIVPGVLPKVFNESSFSYVLAKDFIEHHFHWEARKLLQDFNTILKPGGILELILPNVENIINDNKKSVEEKRIWLYGGQDLAQEWEKDNPNPQRKKYPQYFCHKFGWTKEFLAKELEEVGFNIKKLEDQGWNMRVLTEKIDFIRTNEFTSENNKTELPVHFFSIVLNGFPFIKYHINAFKDLPFKWHWHIIEGVADLKHDTAWSVEKGGKISNELHRNGLSKDSTSEYLDELKELYHENISIYRKPAGEFWDGKLEMINIPLEFIKEEALLWQIDSDELWKAEQIVKARDLFLNYPQKTSAYYYCNYFVGEKLVTTTKNSYGNHTDYEWIRTWRFKPGDKWIAHEPPKLCRKISNQHWVDLAQVNPFLHKETEFYELVFQHYAYTTEEQLRFKEIYYGYKDAVKQWKALQLNSSYPVKLKDYFSWVEDETVVNTITSQNIKPLALKDKKDNWIFNEEIKNQNRWKRILYVRTDSIGDNILSLPILQHLKINHPDAEIAVVCQQHIAELYETTPFCSSIITFKKNKIFTDEAYRNSIVKKINDFNPDVVVNPVYSREPLTDFLSLNNSAKEKIAFEGDSCNISSEELVANNKGYTRLVPNDNNLKTEFERNKNFLYELGIETKNYNPFIWTTESDETFAENFFRKNNLDPKKTIALFPFSQEEPKNYDKYDEVINEFTNYTFLIFGGKENLKKAEDLIKKLKIKYFNLAGETTLRQMTALIKRCALYIGADSAGAHIACAVNTPNVVLLGGGHFGRFLPYSKLTSIVCFPMDCYGCNWKCKYDKSICIKDVDDELVRKAVLKTLTAGPFEPAVYLQVSDQTKEKVCEKVSKFIQIENVNVIEYSTTKDSVKLSEEQKSKKLKISVITPSYNQADYLEQTIQSVLNQNYPDLEYIIIDGGSNDKSVDIIKKFEEKISYWVSEKDNGQADAVNKGFKKASGDIIGWINSDDWYEPGVFEAVNEFFTKNPAKNIVMGNCNLVNEEGVVFDLVENYERGINELKKYWVGKSIPTQPAIFFRKKLLDDHYEIDANLFYAMDYDLWMKFALQERFYHINKTFASYRFHPDAKGGDQDWSKFYKEWNYVFNKYAQKGKTPLVSVIIPCYNYAGYLREAVESVVQQTFKDFEIIIVNDGSTDNTKEVAKELILKYQNDYRIKLINQQNSGQPAIARNNGIKESKGEYILCLDADDKIAPTMLEECFFTLEANPSLGIAYTHRQDFDGADNLVKALEYNFETLKLQNIMSVCSLFRKKAWEEVGGYRTNVKGLEDWDFWIAIGEKGYYGKLIPKPLFFYRRHDTGVFQEAIQNQKKKFAQIILNNRSVYSSDDIKAAEAYLQINNEDKQIDFSVIIPTYNRKEDLRKAIKSVLNQMHKNFEIIVVNDAGEDLNETISEFNDQRIKYFLQEENKGLAAARNRGIKNSSGKYIALLDDDDIFYPHHLQRAMDELILGQKVVYTDAVRASYESNKLISKEVPYSIDYDRNKLLIGNIAPVNCFVFEKEIAIKAGLFDESLSVLEDWEFWLRLSSLAGFRHIKEATVQVNWKKDGSTMTSSKQNEFGEIRKKIYHKYEKEISSVPNKEQIVEEFNKIWKNDFSTNKPLVSIIVLTYNGLDYTKEFVNSVLKNTNENYELIIVDNASTDHTVQYLKELEKNLKHIKVIFNKENLGFPAGVNQGIVASSGSYILLANNDILVTEGWLERLIEVAESDYHIGIVGPICNEVSGVQKDNNAKYNSIEEMLKYAENVRTEKKGMVLEFPRITFLCALIKKELVYKIGGLDERFSPGNFEDDDFSLRAQLAGFKAVVAKDIFIHHFGSKSFTADGIENYTKRLETNKKIFIEKWGADPEEIWLKGKQVKNRRIFYPLNENNFKQNFERALIQLEEKEYEFALNSVLKTVESFNEEEGDSNKIDLKDLYNLAGNLELLLEQNESARNYFEKALNLDPESSQACNGLGETFFIEKNYEAAKTMFEWAVKNNPANVTAIENLEKVNNALGLSVDLSLNPENILTEAAVLFINKKYDDALTKLLIAEEKFNGDLTNPDNAEFAASFLNLKGFNYLGLNDVESANLCFETALSTNPQSSQACAGLAEIFYRKGMNEESKLMFEWAVKNNPENKFAEEGLSKINSLLGFEKKHSSIEI